MSRTGTQLLAGFSRFIGDEYDPVGLSTSAAGDSAGTSLIDDTLGEFEDDTLVGYWIRVTQSGSNQYQSRRIVKNESVSGLVEVRPAFPAQIASADTYELHRHNPRLKFTALDEARIRVFPDLAQTVYDDTTTSDGISRVYPIPTSMRQGPIHVMLEVPHSADVDWNALADPNGDSVSNYTASSATASTVDRSDFDRLVPKHGEKATKLVTAASTAATYTQTVSAMSGVTAATAADRKMAHVRWVYCTEASKVRLQIIDDASTESGSYHGGNGWELLTVEKTIDGDNSTTLSVRVDIASTANPSTIYTERSWFYFGGAERVRDGVYYGSIPQRVRKDDTTNQVYLDYVPPRGYQLRFIGRETLSALGTVIATQVTNTMEVDEENEQILFAEAAKILYQRLGLNVSDFGEIGPKIQFAEGLRSQMKNTWGQTVPKKPLRGWLS